MAVKCFDVVFEVTEEANKRFAPLFKINNERLDVLKQYCGVIDSLIKEFDGESIDVEVSEEDMTVCIQIECCDLSIEDKQHLYYKLIEKTLSFGFKHSDEGNVIVEFVFPSLWEKAI